MMFPRFDDQQAIDAERLRVRDRRLEHIRELRGTPHRGGLASHILAALPRLRSLFTRRATGSAEEHEMTDYVCRLDDGSMGRVAVREADGEWIMVCVRPA